MPRRYTEEEVCAVEAKLPPPPPKVRLGAPPLPDPSPLMWDDAYLRKLRRTMRGRHSWLPSRRRRAHAACLKLIEHGEAMLARPEPGGLPAARSPFPTPQMQRVYS